MQNLLFVYGTLMRNANGTNQRLLAQAEFLGLGSIAGKLYQLQHYPGAVRTTNQQQRVYGEVYRLPDVETQLPKLDAYEECTPDFPSPHEYRRCRLPITLSDGRKLNAWVYLYNLSTSRLQQIHSGDYRQAQVQT
jgi:gamma-glutamylcyclotransferase (GGCT)/AIG2-like uncharacterized protein YtfP